MKLKALFILTIFSLLASCGTSSYHNLKFQKENKKQKSELSNNPANSEDIINSTRTETILTAAKSVTEIEEPIHIEQTIAQPDEIASVNTSMEASSFEKTKKPLIGSKTTKHKNDESPELNTKYGRLAVIFGGLSFIPVVGWVFSILAIIQGSIAITKARRYPNEYGGEKEGKTGIILGTISLIIGMTIVIILLTTVF
tara:strand:- start:3039 stop:3632 length:594 start_codon:yes stop_codon:yes gene_type:complete